MQLKISSPDKEGNFSVSKWIKHQLLLDAKEMGHLIEHLSPCYFLNVSTISSWDEMVIAPDQFLFSYQSYIENLRIGKPLEKQPREFSCALSADLEALYAYEIQPGRYMAKPLKPLIQLQPHRFFHSKIAQTIHSMVMGPESIHWGLQIAYPQIFFDGNRGVYSKVNTEKFLNTALFTQMAKWLRKETVPTTFVYQGQKISTPLRLGKNCFSWIASHPQLVNQGLSVHVY